MSESTSFKLLRFSYGKVESVYELLPERIPYMDLTCCISGKMIYVYENKEYELNNGDAILFPKGTVRARKQTDKETVYSSFNISYDDYIPSISGYLPNSLGADTAMVLHSVKKSFESLTDFSQEKCLSLFWYLYYQIAEATQNNETPHIKSIKQYVAKHYKEKITLTEIANEVHIAPEYCSSLFAKQVGISLFDFISKMRIEEAKSLIITTDYSFTKVAELCGFDDYNYFSRVFKKVVGVPPKDFRKLKRNFN